jgi:cytoskeleton protein RodZ
MNPGSDEASTTAPEQAGSAASTAQSPGALLEQERTRRGLSIQEAAEGLHLDTWIIEAIESNRFLALGAPVYAKGYLRKYAALLGLAPEVIVARYDALTDTLPEPTPVPIMTTAPPPRPKWPKYLGWSLLVVVAIAIGFVLYKFVWPLIDGLGSSDVQSTVTVPAGPAVAEAPAPPTIVAPSPASESAPAQAQPAPPPAEARPSPAATQAPVAASSEGAPGDAVRLTLAFDTPSWVEVYDAGGGRLMYDIGQAGRVHRLEGQPPLNVVIGVANAVKVRVNDQDIVVPRRANRDSTRFIVAADGSVR